MKRRLFLMLAVLMQMAGMQLVAQTSSLLTMELGDPLIYDGSQITSNASDEVEGLNMDFLVDGNPNTFWHSDWHGKVAESHYLQFELLDPITDDNLVIYVQRRNIEKDHLTNATITASSDGETWEQIADVEFGNAYALGEFVTDPIRISKPYSYIRITRNPVGDENIFFHLAEIELYNPSDNMYTAGILNNTFIKYETYYWDENGEELNMGTGFGQHSDFDSWKEFLKMMDKVLYYLTERDVADFPNREEAQEIGRTVDSLYQKIVDSEVPFVLPQTEGYYRIIANLPFYTEEVVGKDDNNLDIIERTYHTKAMFCSLDEKGAWGTLQEDRANFLWKLTQTGDSIDMYNAGMETRFSVFGSSVKMSQESDTHVIMDWAGNENGRDIIYIRPAAGSKNGSDYLHMSSHNRGRQTDDKVLCTWVGTFNMGEPYESDKGTSEWYLEPVSDEEAAALIEAFGMVKNHEILVAENEKLRREVEQEIAVAKDPILKPLITSASQMTSPFSQNDLGARDGGDLSEGVLLDGNLGTYWHSVWSNGAVGQGEHYIQVSDMEEMTDDIKIYVGRRQVGEGHVTEFQLRGSNDPDAEKEDWKILATQSIGNASNGAEYTTPAFNVGQTPYAYVRLYATQNTYWHCSELQIYKSLENPNSQFASLGEIAIKLEEEFLRNSAISDDDLTPEDYKALEEAYMAFRAGLVDPTELRNALAFYAGAANGNVEGTETGFWSNSQAKDDFVKLYTEVEEYNNAGRYDENQNRIYVAALQAASETLERGAIGIDTDSWYHLKFASADMYDENNWDKGNVESSDMGVNLYGTYVTVGQTIYEEDQLVDIQEYNANDMREGNGMYFLPEDQCSKQDASLFRFILAENPADSISDFNSLLAKARNAIEINTRYTYGDNLITDARQLSSNASDRAEGQYIENLIDNDPNTFWHSDWHGEATSTHYLQVALTKPISDPVQVIVTRRQGTNGGNIERMYMAGSNDGQEWTNIGYVDLPYRQVNETVTSKPVALGGTYSYLRFYLTKRSEDSKEYIPMGEDWTF
ncbi:MAG: discoidin domain-containing protein, partial [Bacteroidaceae bacterium]